jgi:hypothetical protein
MPAICAPDFNGISTINVDIGEMIVEGSAVNVIGLNLYMPPNLTIVGDYYTDSGPFIKLPTLVWVVMDIAPEAIVTYSSA